MKAALVLPTACVLTIPAVLAWGQEVAAPKVTPATVKTALGTIAARVSLPDSLNTVNGLVLRFDAVTFHGLRYAGLRLFLNKPEADASTPIADPAYLGSISPGHFDEKMTATGDFVLDVSTMKDAARQAVAAALKSGELTVFCVPVFRKGSEVGPPSISVGKVELKQRRDSE